MGEPYLPDAKLEAVLAPHLRELSFVNIGASDGVSNDPVYPFVCKYGWRGLLVEPVPHVFELLVQNYSALPGMRFDNTLVGASARVFHCLPDDYCCDHPWARQIGSFDVERVRWAIAWIAKNQSFPGVRLEDMERISAVTLPCVTLPELLERHRIERFDVLNLDTEGTDLEILENAVLTRYGVRAAIVEKAPYEDGRIAALLAEQGFEHVSEIDFATDAFVRR